MSETTTRLLLELRKRVGWSVVSLGTLSIVTFYFANQLYTWLAIPLLKQFNQGQHLIATNIVSAFFTPFELAFCVAVFLAIPIFFYHVWAFVAPALYRQERRAIWPFLLGSLGLFYLGIAFAYYVIFPILFAFLTHAAPKDVLVMPDITSYMDFSLKLLLTFGLLFEIPIILIFLVKTKIISRDKLVRARPYMIVGAFVMGMLLAPPDVLSQTLVALPLWCLYEIGLFLLRFIE